MSTETIIQAVPGTLDAGYCPANWQEFYLAILAKTTWKVPGTFKPYIISATQPGVDDQDKIWKKVSSTGAPIREFVYESTYGWVAEHPIPPGPTALATMIWKGTTVQLETYDGGAAGAVGPITGPMWEVDAGYADHFPLGVGVKIAAPDGESTVFEAIGPDDPKGRGVYFIRRSARTFYVP